MLVQDKGNERLFWCPGCEDLHLIEIRPNGWTELGVGSYEPSIKVGGVQWPVGHTFHRATHNVEPGKEICCHSFLRNQVWIFLEDSTHHLAGQSVPMVDLPDWLTA